MSEPGVSRPEITGLPADLSGPPLLLLGNRAAARSCQRNAMY
jgi:hypothetical protein